MATWREGNTTCGLFAFFLHLHLFVLIFVGSLILVEVICFFFGGGNIGGLFNPF